MSLVSRQNLSFNDPAASFFSQSEGPVVVWYLLNCANCLALEESWQLTADWMDVMEDINFESVTLRPEVNCTMSVPRHQRSCPFPSLPPSCLAV